MSIYNATGHQTNSIDLAQYDDIGRLNELMIAEGFRKMTEEEREVWQEQEKARSGVALSHFGSLHYRLDLT